MADTELDPTMVPKETIEAFDDWLVGHSLFLEAVVIGGSALALLGVTDRQTRDFDILHPELPTEILLAAREFAAAMRGERVALTDDWLNNGPRELAGLLPSGWERRLRPAFEGKSLLLHTLGRTDLLCAKLFALCDRGTDLADCIALAPTAQEIDEVEPWLREQDANPMWPEHVRATLEDLRRRLSHGL